MDFQLGSLRRQLTSKADVIVEDAIAAPSHARCALAAVLLRALPLNISHTAGLFHQADLDPSESGWSHSAVTC